MAPIACRPIIKCGKSGCPGSCPLSVVGYGYTAGKKPATCRTWKTFPRPNVTLSDFLPAKSERKKGNRVETPLPACHAAVETPLPLCLANQAWSLGVIHHASNQKRTVRCSHGRRHRNPSGQDQQEDQGKRQTAENSHEHARGTQDAYPR